MKSKSYKVNLSNEMAIDIEVADGKREPKTNLLAFYKKLSESAVNQKTDQ